MFENQTLNDAKKEYLEQVNHGVFNLKNLAPVWVGLNNALTERADFNELVNKFNTPYPAQDSVTQFKNDIADTLADKVKSDFESYLMLSPKNEQQLEAQKAYAQLSIKPECRVLVREKKGSLKPL